MEANINSGKINEQKLNDFMLRAVGDIASTISAPGITGGLAAGMSKYRHPAPIRKLNTKPITIFIAVSGLN